MPNRKKKTMGAFNCQTCMGPKPAATEATRRVLHCGFMPREQWAGKFKLPQLGPEKYTLDVCPGWLVRQPDVVEGREAYEALEAGTLHLFDPHNTYAVYQAAMHAKNAFGLHQIEQLEQPPGRP